MMGGKTHAEAIQLFCPEISTTPREFLELQYEKEPSIALISYPGAGGCVTRALSYSSVHRRMQVENAKQKISDILTNRDKTAYAESWVERWLEWELRPIAQGEGSTDAK